MTTAHRPTFYQALGGDNQGGNYLVAPTTKVSSRDLPGHTTLKLRHARPRPMYSEDVELNPPQGREAIKSLLNKQEKENYERKEREKAMYTPIEALSEIRSKLLPFDKLSSSSTLADVNSNPFPEDTDDYGPLSNETIYQTYQNGSDDDDDSEDDEEELLRELEKIKRERQKEEELKKKQEEENEAPAERIRILQSNPLIVNQQSTLKRRWDDDVVFRNQAKNIQKPKKRFINDTVRSDFHKKFLARYIH